MPAFEKIHSGLAGLDLTLDSIRIGDNVVWQVSSVDDYRLMAVVFALQAIKDKRKLIYIRFAPHEPLFTEQSGLTIYRLDPSPGFESFTGEMHRIIAEAGKEAFYIFDCLSELQTAWAADLMMGNFFMVTCPFLFELDTVAWFCILRHRHSYDTIARIRETTQILLDLYPDDGCLYIHPIKVWKRYAPTMFFPHRLCLETPDLILPITDGVSVSRFYQLVGNISDHGGERNLDSWERFFIEARSSVGNSGSRSEELVRTMAERLVGTESRLLSLILHNCSVSDLLEVKERMIGSGKVGGKAAGMILARRIVQGKLPDLSPRIEPHDSFYVGSDVFYTYLVHNRLWKLRILQRTAEGYFTQAASLRDGILAGSFPDQIREQFVRTLEYFGQTPIIVRSSSLLEDSFGHAFAGKYESVFCVNTGSPEDRQKAFESAMKAVYASTMDVSALAYRKQRGLQGQDEQMAILVQRVSGSLFSDFFMPAVAGVGYSFNTWRWHKDLNPAAGMIRLVIGLGTRAVDRTSSDYPRLVSLDRSDLDPSGNVDRSRYCQRSVDGLDLTTCSIATRDLVSVLPLLPKWLALVVAERDTVTEQRLAESGVSRQIFIGTCSGVVEKKQFLSDLQRIMQTLQAEYDNPVDIEFTANWGENGEYMINLLQCRPLQTPKLPTENEDSRIDDGTVSSFPKENIFLFLHRDTMGPALHCRVDAVILIDPKSYYLLPYKDKPGTARAVGELNAYFREKGFTVMLLAPGRIGTSSPELGLPVSFAEIDSIRILCEVAYSEAGYQPELSFGSHFFQDLVESDIFYAAIPEELEPSIFHPGFFQGTPDRLKEILPDTTLPPGLLSVYETDNLFFFSDVLRGSCLCARVK